MVVGDSVIIRMNYSTLVELFRVFPKQAKESVAHYFVRLNRYLKGGLK